MLLWLILASAQSFAGGLPVAIDGEPLPSLAPMLEQTTPAVVNISTRGTVSYTHLTLPTIYSV